MSETQTHIVYRNRIEHDFYESGMLVPLGGALIVGFLVFLALCNIFEKHMNRWIRRDRNGNNTLMVAFGFVAVGCGVAVFKYLTI